MRKYIALIGLSAVVFAACNSTSQPTPAPENQEQTDEMPAADTTTTESVQGAQSTDGEESAKGEVKEFTVVGDDFSFDKKEIKVKEGDTVKIIFQNKKGFHDWVLDEFDARTKQLQAGSEETIEFVASKKGTYEYYCSVGKHRQMGMVGKLIVE